MTKNRNNDLWADISEVTEVSPKELMKEQAAYLKQKTKGLLSAEVVTSSILSNTSFMNGNSPSLVIGPAGTVLEINPNRKTLENITQTFYLVIPKIKYRYELFSVKHDVFSYPAEFIYDSDIKIKNTATNEKEFLATLKQILSSARTQQILSSLLGQAKA